jgi:hypothetical protein
MQMSAAVTRAKRLEHNTNELTRRADRGIHGKPEARSVIEDHGMTPLMRAARDGSAGTVQALLDRGAEVNAKRSDGFNALALAAFFGHSQVVWLLLDNGADLSPTGRSETLPEMWADIRGFVDIGDTLRGARAAKEAEASNPRTAVIGEPTRFPRTAESEKLEPPGSSDRSAEISQVEEARDSETTLAMRPAPPAEESTTGRTESSEDALPSDKAEPQQQPVIKQPLPAAKTLPEIKDTAPLVVPEFHPGSVFVARITSSRKNLLALIVVVWLVCAGIAAFLFPHVRKSLGDLRTPAVTNTTNPLTQPSNPIAGSETSVSGTVETPSAATTESTNAPGTNDIEETTADTRSVESPSLVESAAGSENGSAGIALGRGSDSRAHPRSSISAVTTVNAGENKRELTAATSMSRSAVPARKQRGVSRGVKFRPQTAVEEQPKPAPLSVEVSRSRSVLPTRNANEVLGSQPPPLGIISGKPKPKVIQWP